MSNKAMSKLKPPVEAKIHRFELSAHEECDITVWGESNGFGRLAGLEVRHIKGPCVIELMSREVK